MFDAVVSVDTFNGCCERLSVKSGREGRDVGVVTKFVDPDDAAALDGGGIDGIGMCFNIYSRYGSLNYRHSINISIMLLHFSVHSRDEFTTPMCYNSHMLESIFISL